MADKLLYQLLIEKNQLAKDLADSVKKNAKLEAGLKKTGNTGSKSIKKISKETSWILLKIIKVDNTEWIFVYGRAYVQQHMLWFLLEVIKRKKEVIL